MVRGSLWAVIARRSSASGYARRRAARRAPGGAKTQALVDAQGGLAEPTMVEQLAVSMADRLPGALVAMLGVRGMLGLAWLVAAPPRCLGTIASLLIGPRPGAAEGRR